MSMMVVMMGVIIAKVKRHICRESWRCVLALCYGMIIISNDVVNLMMPIVSMVGNKLMTICTNTMRPLAQTIEGWSRKRTRWRSARNKIKPGRGRMHYVMTALMACPAGVSGYNNHVHFDTDSYKIGIDNRCSACILHKIGDFVGNLVDSNKSIRGFGGTRTKTLKYGTLLWKWMDNDGLEHSFKIPNSYYVPEGGMRLLSPQHWAKEIGKPQDAGEDTNGVRTCLYWNKGKNELEVPLGINDNVSTFETAPGYNKYHAFCASVTEEDMDEKPELIANLNIVSDDEEPDIDDGDYNGIVMSKRDLWVPMRSRKHLGTDVEGKEKITFDIDGETLGCTVIPDEEDMEKENTTAELLRLHQKFSHISFKKLQAMGEQGIIPKKFAKCAIPACSACLYAKATRKQWRSKNTRNKVEKIPKEPGDLVSIDQLKSPTPGFIAQMCGILTVKRYKVATVFVDQASRFSYVHYQRSDTTEETIQVKKAFEKMASINGVQVKNYHTDNGIFKANKWMEHCHESGQGMTFAAVNAHHTNGLAERRIRELQDLTRTNMIHANRRWPDAITANLWPYAMRMGNEAINDTPSLQDKARRSPRQIFTGTMININPKHYKPFGCPVYVLDNALATGNIFHKWKERSRVGIYLGKSPVHAKNVALVLNMETGHVSPQFHVKFDPSFHTVKENKWSSKWQVLAGFVRNKEPNKKATNTF